MARDAREILVSFTGEQLDRFAPMLLARYGDDEYDTDDNRLAAFFNEAIGKHQSTYDRNQYGRAGIGSHPPLEPTIVVRPTVSP